MGNPIQKVKLPFQTRVKKRIELVLKRKKLIIGFLILGLLTAFVISMFLPKYYRATGKIFLKYSSVHNNSLENSGNIDKEMSLFESFEFIDAILNKLSARNIKMNSQELRETQEILVNETASIIGLVIVSNDAIKASEIANLSINEFYNTSILNSQSYLINALQVISNRESVLMESINQGLSNTNTDVLNSLSLQQENLISKIAEFESELESIELDNQIFSFELNRLRQILQNRYPNLSDEILYLNDPDLNSHVEKLQRMQAVTNLMSVSRKLGGIQIQYLWPESYDINDIPEAENEFFDGLDNYIVQNYSDQFSGNENFLIGLVRKLFEVQIKVDGIDLTKSTIFNNITSLENRFNQIPFSKIDEARASRLRKFNNSLLIKIRTKNENLLKRQTYYFAEVDYITDAKVPESYFSPSITLNSIIGAFIGFLIGLLFAFSKGKVQIELIESADDLDKHGFKLLSQVPAFPPGSPILFDKQSETDENKLDPHIVQAFSSIETFIKYGSLEKPLKSVLITSGQSSEGKSVVSSNLAIALANSGNKVILVDANLKYPVLYKFFKVKSTPSLAHYLFRKKEFEEIIRKTHNKNLDLITCIEFPQNPAVIMTSERMKNFVDIVKHNYDYVIYDSCSLNLLEETIKFADLMDEVILVARAGKTKLSELLSVQNLLHDNGLFDCEIILNDVKRKKKK